MSLRTACGSRASVWVVTVALLAALSSCQNRHQSFGSGAASPSAAAVPTGGPPRVRGFVLSNVFVAAPPDEPGACPQLSKGPLELFLESLPAAERKRYAEQREALMKLMNQRVGFRAGPVPVDPNTGQAGPEQVAQTRRKLGIPEGKGSLSFLGKQVTYDSCSNPDDFPQFDRGLQPYLGKTAYGADLDGRQSTEDFVGVGGEASVDNALWRALGCEWAFHESGKPEVAAKVLFSARAPTLVEISDMDDVRNDADVQVSIYSSLTPLAVDAAGHALARASFDIDGNPQLQARTHGRIVEGVLTTEPFDVQINYKEQIIDTVRKLRATRLRALLKEDGTIEGGFYGYYDVESFWHSVQQMTQLGASFSRLSCPAVRTALNQYADAFPDPKTGRNTAISTAMQFVGVRAHIIHPSAGT